MQTATVIAAIVASACILIGEVRTNRAAIDELRQDARELRGLLINHLLVRQESKK